MDWEIIRLLTGSTTLMLPSPLVVVPSQRPCALPELITATGPPPPTPMSTTTSQSNQHAVLSGSVHWFPPAMTCVTTAQCVGSPTTIKATDRTARSRPRDTVPVTVTKDSLFLQSLGICRHHCLAGQSSRCQLTSPRPAGMALLARFTTLPYTFCATITPRAPISEVVHPRNFSSITLIFRGTPLRYVTIRLPGIS